MEVRMSIAMEIPDFRAASVCLRQIQKSYQLYKQQQLLNLMEDK